MHDIDCQLSKFNPIDLNGLMAINLLKRYDTKFMFHRSKLPSVLERLKGDCAVLDTGGKRTCAYRTLYYDTDNYLFYHQHHDQRVNRNKLRSRRYVDSGQCYFEVKSKNNKKMTHKYRMRIDDGYIHDVLTETSKSFAKACLNRGDHFAVDTIKPVLWIDYRRITLANTKARQRITVDVALRYSDDSRRLELDNLVIAELKQARPVIQSGLFALLKGMKIRPVKFSKYCMGIALMQKAKKTNRFKKNILRLQKLIGSENTAMAVDNEKQLRP